MSVPHRLALLLLCAAYLQGGIDKALDLPGAIAEVAGFGLPWPGLVAPLTIALELGGSVLILVGVLRRPAALALAVFTLAATLLANRYWTLPPGAGRAMAANGFYEYLGLIGGFLLVGLGQERAA